MAGVFFISGGLFFTWDVMVVGGGQQILVERVLLES